MRVKITELHPESTWVKLGREKEVLGKVFTVLNIHKANGRDGYYSASFVDNSVGYIYGFKYIEIPEPSAMSELGKWIDEHKIADTSSYWYCDYEQKQAPKKLSWWQKIRGYDDVVRQRNQFRSQANDLYSRCAAAEAMRDHYKTICTSKDEEIKNLRKRIMSAEFVTAEALRDRDMHARTADNWQQKLIDQNATIGKRLKFSVGTYKITIVVGNPVTACYFTYYNIAIACDEEFLAVSICHKNDQFDWKRGVIEALENMIGQWLGNAYGDTTLFYNALFTAYPEIGIQPVEPKKPVKKTKKATK